ncbi:MAG: EthD domain-containing protein [Actinobacteria bacterium]|nr:EthD domain-containing protein [Actinomycetota bacterium]
MVRLTCILRRKAGMTPAEFHQHWEQVHAPLIERLAAGSHVLKYEQHPRPLESYSGDDDPGFDGVTLQWFASMEAYEAHMAEPDFADMWTDIESFLDVGALHFVVTPEPGRLIFDRR